MSYAKLGTLKNISWNFVLNPYSCYWGIIQSKCWPCPSHHVQSNFLSDANLWTLRNIFWNFELNLSCHYRWIVLTNFGFALLTIYSQNFCLLTVYGQNFCPTNHLRLIFLEFNFRFLWRIFKNQTLRNENGRQAQNHDCWGVSLCAFK